MSTIDYLIAFTAALSAGFMDAIIGGGGLISLPVILGLGLPPQEAIATSKLQASMASVAAVFSLRKELKLRKLLLGIAVTAVFSTLGSFALIHADNRFLMPLILCILIAVFIYTIAKPDFGSVVGKALLPSGVFLVIFGIILGFYDGFFGPGTGSFWIMAFVLFAGSNIRSASINTKVLNTTSNLCSLAFFALFFKIHFALGFFMGIGGMIGAFLGGKMLLKINISLIKRIFNIIVFLTIIKLIYGYFF